MNALDCIAIGATVVWIVNFIADFFLERKPSIRSWLTLLCSLAIYFLTSLAANEWRLNLGSGGLLLVIFSLTPIVFKKLKERLPK